MFRPTLLLFALLLSAVTALAADNERIVFFSPLASGGCSLRSWNLDSKEVTTLKTLIFCPRIVRADDSFTYDNRSFYYGYDRKSLLFIVFENGKLLSADAFQVPTDWELIRGETFKDYTDRAVGRFDDTFNPGLAREERTGSDCMFQFIEYVGGGWKRRPDKPCSYGDFGAPRFGWKTHFTESESAMNAGSCGRSILGPPAYDEFGSGDESIPIKGGIARKVAGNIFANVRRSNPPEEREGVWYYRELRLASGSAFIYYDLLVGDYVHVNNVYLKPARSRSTMRLGRGEGQIVGKYLLFDSKLIDLETGLRVFKQPTLNAFWYCY